MQNSLQELKLALDWTSENMIIYKHLNKKDQYVNLQEKHFKVRKAYEKAINNLIDNLPIEDPINNKSKTIDKSLIEMFK